MNKKQLLTISTIVLLFFGILILKNYAGNTYLFLQDKEYIKNVFSSFTLITGSILWFIKLIHLPFSIVYLLSYTVSFIFMVLSINELSKSIKKYITNDFLSLLITLSIILNPVVISLWLSFEKAFIMISLYASIKAYTYFEEELESKKKNIGKILLSLFLSFLTNSSITNMFLFLSIIPIVRNKNTYQEKLQSILKSFSLYTIPAIIKSIWTILLNKQSLLNLFYFENISLGTKEVLSYFKNTFYLYKPILGILFIVITLGTIIYFIYKSKARKPLLITFFSIIILFIIGTIYPFLWNKGDIEVGVEYTYASMMLFGILFLIFHKRINKNLITCFLITMLVIEYISFSNASIKCFIENEREKQFVISAEEKVKEYEKMTSEKISNIAIYKNENTKKQENLSLAMYEYYSNRELEKTSRMEFINSKYFEDKNWDTYSTDQIVITSGIIHWYLY